jgi:hypothetical protein
VKALVNEKVQSRCVVSLAGDWPAANRLVRIYDLLVKKNYQHIANRTNLAFA